MNKEKWNEINFLLSENIKTDISENDFENNIIQALRVLDWKEYLGDFDIRPSFHIGASNRIIPDFVIKSDSSKLFVVEIKQPNIPLTSSFQKQLFSYMRILKLEYGILIGQSIQIFYDGDLIKQEDPILLENIKFERNSEKGEKFIELFSKNEFSINTLNKFTLKSIEKINKKEDFKLLTKKILSPEFNDKIYNLIKQEYISDYDGELIDSVLNEIDFNIYKKQDFIELPVVNESFTASQNTTNRKKTGVIASIQKLLTAEPKSQEQILKELVTLFPERSEESMRNTVRAQLGGSNRPLRIERERNFTLIISNENDSTKKYSIKVNPYTNSILPIQLNPPGEINFKRELLKTKTAYITTYFSNGTSDKKTWNANRFTESSGVLGNLRSRPEFRNGEWQERGITKVYVSIVN